MKIKTNPKLKRGEWALYLLLTYAGIVLIRFLLALYTTSFPTVGIDEYLYYSLARSIATEGKLLFHGQSADYAYLLYPLTLSPIYVLFQEGAPFYRLLQLWNIVLMTSSLFPLFFLGKKMLSSEKQAFIFAFLSMLLPDYVLGSLIFSESLLYPLFFTLIYCVYSYIETEEKRYLLWSGLLGGLLYSTKPGAIAPAIVFLFLAAIQIVHQKKAKDLLWIAVSLMSSAATAGFFLLLAKFAFGYEGRFFSVYEAQLDGTRSWNLLTFFKSLALYPFYFILGCGIFGFVLPLLSFKTWKSKPKAFAIYVFSALTVMIVGSAWAVDRGSELNTIHLRYIAMYIPLMLLFCVYNGQEDTAIRKNKQTGKNNSWISAGCVSAYMVLCCLVFGCKEKAQSTDTHAQVSVSFLNDHILPVSMEWIGNVLIILCCLLAFYLFFRKSEKQKLGKICLWTMVGCMVINGSMTYAIKHNNVYPELEKDGVAVQNLTAGRPYIQLLASDQVAELGVDVHSRQNSCVVYTSDFLNHLKKTNGVYTPFVPNLIRGVSSVRETPDVDTLVVDYDTFPNLQLSSFASVESANDHNTVYVIHFTKGKRLLDGSLSNLQSHILAPERPGIISIYNEEYLKHPLKIRLEIESNVNQEMTINSAHGMYAGNLIPGKQWYEINFQNPERTINFQVQEAAITVSAFELVSE